MSWLLNPSWSQKWKDSDQTFCASHYRNMRSLKYFLKFTQKTLSGCPERCDCEVADEQIIVSVDDIEAVNIQARVKVENFKVSVFCVGQSLTQLPVSLPPDTIYLNLENNQIDSLEPLSRLNPDYKHVEKLVLTNNSISSLRGLETSWLHKTGPTLLDLRHNNIRELDTTALESMLYRASIMRESEYFLAENPWSCNCHNIKIIQEFLSKYNNIILDVEDMKCTECDCSIIFLDYKEMCGSSGTDSMVWVIVLEITLLVIVLVKLTWDCIRYRRTGHLPWIARHMCCSDLTRSRWSAPRLPGLCSGDTQEASASNRIVSKGSSGYITCSATSRTSSNSDRTPRGGLPGGKESSVVRFL